jgi:hypothetical protein
MNIHFRYREFHSQSINFNRKVDFIYGNILWLYISADYLTIDGIHVIDAVYAPLIGGFSVVLSDGRAALLTSPNPKFHPNVK